MEANYDLLLKVRVDDERSQQLEVVPKKESRYSCQFKDEDDYNNNIKDSTATTRSAGKSLNRAD